MQTGFSWLALAGEVASIGSIIFLSYLIKVLVILLVSPITALIMTLVNKNKERPIVSI